MSEPDLSGELQLLFRALANSATLIYQAHREAIKLVALCLLTLMAFKLGRVSVTDPIDQDVRSISQSLTNRQHYTLYLPQKIKAIAKTRRNILVFFLVLSSSCIGVYFFQQQLSLHLTILELQIGGLILTIILGSAIVTWLYEKVLGLMMRRGGFNDQLIH
jgi:hypothetical protein